MRYIGIVLVAASIVLCGATLCYLAAGGGLHELQQVRVTVTRADTGKPERDVVVAATWTSTERLTVHGDRPVRVLRTAEAVTDANGLAVFPGASVERQGTEVVRWWEPTVAVYKRGFVTEPGPGVAPRTFRIRPAAAWEDLPAWRETRRASATAFPRLQLELSSPAPLSRTPPAP
jgi:hypothetical protein